MRFFTVFFVFFLGLYSFFWGADVFAEQGPAAVKPSDQFFFRQLYLTQTGVPDAWAFSTGSHAVTVALLDSGVDIHHPDLVENIWTNDKEVPGDGVDNDANGYIDDIHGWDFVNEIPDPSPKFGGPFTAAGIHHGTLIAGLIAAQGNNGLGVAGVSWHSRIMPLRVLNNQGEGDVLSVVRAIDYAIAARVKIINMSFVGSIKSELLASALARANAAGITIVAAAGNDSVSHVGSDLSDRPLYPVCNDEGDIVIGVGSTDSEGKRAAFSNFGQCVDIAAPGSGIVSTQVVNYEYPGFTLLFGGGWSGTSLSTGIVSGALALLKSVDSSLSPLKIKNILFKTCTPVEGKETLGCGQINIAAALREAVAGVQHSGEPSSFLDSARIAVTSADGKEPLRLFDMDGVRTEEPSAFFPFAPFHVPYTLKAFSDEPGVFVAAVSAKGGPYIRIFNSDFSVRKGWFAFDERFRGGVNIAVGDVDGDGQDEIVATPGVGGGPYVRIFDKEGSTKRIFLAGNPRARGGLSVALGDLNNDGRDEIVVVPRSGEKVVATVFQGTGKRVTQFPLFAAREAQGALLAIGDGGEGGAPSLIAAPLKGDAPVKIFSPQGQLLKSFFPFGKGYKNGFALSTLNHDDGAADILLAPAGAGGPFIGVFDAMGRVRSLFRVFDEKIRTGLSLGVL